MNKSFWVDKPVELNYTDNESSKYIKTIQELVDDTVIHLPLNVKCVVLKSSQKVDEIYLFLKTNYQSTLLYSKELIHYFLKNSIVILLELNDEIIGVIIGKKTTVSVHDKIHETLMVNFLCIHSHFQKKRYNTFLINYLILEAAKHNIKSAFYTISHEINVPYFNKKKYTHRPINILHLSKCDFIGYSLQYNNFFNSFNICKKFQEKYVIKCYNNNQDINVSKLINLLNDWNRITRKIFISYNESELTDIFENDSFYKYLIYEKDEIIGFFIFYLIETKINEFTFRNGYLHDFCITKEKKDSLMIHNCIEGICSFKHFDTLTYQDTIPFKYFKHMKKLPGTGSLKYYAFNLKLNFMINTLNGLITI
jgi:hypothetical protein